MVDLLLALDLRWVMREILVDSEVEVEGTAFVHAFVGINGECEVEYIVRIGERGLHRPT